MATITDLDIPEVPAVYDVQPEVIDFGYRVDYSATPAFGFPVIDIESGPSIPPLGKHFHVGNGIWARVCHECPFTVLSYGAVPIYAGMPDKGVGMHEYTVHQAQVAGINVGLLS